MVLYIITVNKVAKAEPSIPYIGIKIMFKIIINKTVKIPYNNTVL
jgi:hypothetical protein